MDLQSSKIELAKLILNIDNPKIINKIREFLQQETQQQLITLTAHENKEIELALSMLNNGKRISYNDFLKKVS